MSDSKAIVCGCGIAGPVVAMALRRAGIEPVVYEARERGADHVGSFLTTASNGLAALETLGLDGVIRDGFPTPRMVLWSGTGKRLGEVAMGDPREPPSLTIQRGLLHRALRDEALRRGIAIELGKPLVDAVSDGRRVIARFADGSEATGDLLVGADGIHSRVRRIVDPGCPQPGYTGQLSISGIARLDGLAATQGTFHLIYGKRAFFGYALAPTGEVYWFANIAEPDPPTPAALATTSSTAWKRRLRAMFADDAGPAGALIDATAGELAAYAIHDMPPVPVWHRGPIVMIGDAIHATSPSSGQGASLAIEDAVVLAKCIRDVPDLEQAFRLYERLRRPRVERVVRFSRRVGSTKVAGPIARRVRDLVMPLALKLFGRSTMHGWLYRYPIDWDAPVEARAA